MKHLIPLSLICLFGVALLIAGVDDENEQTSIPINKIHEEVTTKFIKAQGFGFRRMRSVEINPDGTVTPSPSEPRIRTEHHLFTTFLEGNEGYEVNLIGLVINQEGAVYRSAIANDKEITERNRVHKKQAEEAAKIPVEDDYPAKLAKLSDSARLAKLREIRIPPIDFIEPLFNGEFTEPEKTTLVDKKAIAHFQSNSASTPQIQHLNDKWIAHGPIRATEAKCMKCHEVEKGALLGVFRYEFPLDTNK